MKIDFFFVKTEDDVNENLLFGIHKIALYVI